MLCEKSYAVTAVLCITTHGYKLPSYIISITYKDSAERNFCKDVIVYSPPKIFGRLAWMWFVDVSRYQLSKLYI
jgi:hypothetical protein